jgi:enamine deaminase RidA (YjgF/YER057c/UK114 family)
MATPNSYSDPYWTQLASATEAKLGLPAGLLGAIVTHGEKSNADQVSEAGARTPFQITPSTRDAVLKRDGIDAYLSPENAAEVAGLVLKDGLNFAKQRTDDPESQTRLAAGFYHAGGDQSNWGPRTHAYVARVSDGAQAGRLDALANDFASFMKANPAVPAASAAVPSAPGATAANDSLSTDFAAWRAQQPAPASSPAAAEPAYSGPSIGDKIVGAGEAGLAAATSIPSYMAFLTGGALQAGKEALYGISAHGTPEYQQNLPGTFDRIADAATKTGNAFQYQPRTDTGQDYARTLADAMTPLAGMNPLEASLIGGGVAPTVQLARSGARAAPQAIADGATVAGNAIRNRVAAVTGGAVDARPTAGTLGSAGAAATDVALQRQETAASLPVPVKLTRGQATRDFADQQFEGETAKNPDVGEPLRENAATQNHQLAQNFDALIDKTGAEKASDIEAGRFIVDDALTNAAARSKAEYKAKYAAAEKAGELEQPVSLRAVIDHLNESAPEATTAPLLATARALAVKLGIAREVDGQLVAAPPKGAQAPAAPERRSSLFGEPPPAPEPEPGVPLKTAEQFRKAINRNTDYDPSNQRQASIINGLIDQATEGKGGDLYKQARQAYQRHAQLFRNNAVVSDLLATKPGTADRRVALDDVMHRIVLQGSREDLSNLRRTLDVSDQHAGFQPGTSGPGRQAWREVQASALRYIAEQAGATGKNAARDTAGRPIISFAGLNQAIRELDDGGRLDFILGKKDAQTVRDIAEIASVIKTVPPGSVNTSNTAATLIALLGESAATTAFTGIPAPLVSIARLVKQKRDTAQLRAKVDAALMGVRPPVVPTTAPAPGYH